jgi:hypothetical protein
MHIENGLPYIKSKRKTKQIGNRKLELIAVKNVRFYTFLHFSINNKKSIKII